MLAGLAFWLMRWYVSLRGGLMKPEIDKAMLRRRVRISPLSPVLYFAGAAISLLDPIVALCRYAAIAAYFAVKSLGHGSSKRAGSNLSEQPQD